MLVPSLPFGTRSRIWDWMRMKPIGSQWKLKPNQPALRATWRPKLQRWVAGGVAATVIAARD